MHPLIPDRLSNSSSSLIDCLYADLELVCALVSHGRGEQAVCLYSEILHNYRPGICLLSREPLRREMLTANGN